FHFGTPSKNLDDDFHFSFLLVDFDDVTDKVVEWSVDDSYGFTFEEWFDHDFLRNIGFIHLPEHPVSFRLPHGDRIGSTEKIDDIVNPGNRLDYFTTKPFRICFYEQISRQYVSFGDYFFTTTNLINFFGRHHDLRNDL